jgi:uncharacterized protein YbjT (DUF2867 family)
MTNATQDLILLTGGTGKTGRRVAERLEALGEPVRIGSRSGSPPFDWEAPATWGPALEGVSAVYITYFPDLSVPGAPEAIDAFTAQAVAAGVRRLVLLSGRGEEEAQRSEEALKAAAGDAEWTIVRSSFFAQNFSEDFWLEHVRAGEVASPAADVPEPFIDIEDIADVVTAALTEDGHARRAYEVTGPRALTFADAVAEIGRASGREVRFTTVPLEAWLEELARHGVADEVAEMLRYIFGEVLDGRNVQTADGVERALARPARDFAEYARRTAATGVWTPRSSAVSGFIGEAR